MYSLKIIDPDVVKEAYDKENVPDYFKEVLLSEEFADDVKNIAYNFQLDEDEAMVLLRELTYIFLGLKQENNFFRDLVKSLVPNESVNFQEDFARELYLLIKPIYEEVGITETEKEKQLAPGVLTGGDNIVFRSKHGVKIFCITDSYFKGDSGDKYPLKYIRSIHYVQMSGFDENGFVASVGFIIFGLLFALISFWAISSANIIMTPLGILGLWLSWKMLKSPFRKAKPRASIEFHPNLGLESVLLNQYLSDDEIEDAVKVLRKYSQRYN